MDVCLSLALSPAMSWPLVQAVLRLSSAGCWDRIDGWVNTFNHHGENITSNVKMTVSMCIFSVVGVKMSSNALLQCCCVCGHNDHFALKALNGGKVPHKTFSLDSLGPSNLSITIKCRFLF